jgi:hypothetical protein
MALYDITGGMAMPDPPAKKRPVGDDEYYSANEKFRFYRDILSGKLSEKYPEEYQEYFSGLVDQRKKDPKKVMDYVKSSKFKGYLSPEEIKSALGDAFDDYVGTVGILKQRGFADDTNRDLYGEVEGDKAISDLAFGKRFLSTPVVTSYSRTTVEPEGKEKRETKIFSFDRNKSKDVQTIVKYN